VLVITDVASRGLDIARCVLPVFNLTCKQAEEFVHRQARQARAGLKVMLFFGWPKDWLTFKG